MAVIRPTALNINKPIGWTSRDVLNKLQSIYSYKKFGHAGTLDPLATGVLVVLVGDECKKQNYYMGQDKTYKTKIIFGCSSPTDDLEGPISTAINPEKFSLQKIKKYLDTHLGEFEQAVPYYSAVKINGKEMYKSARDNQPIPKKPVKIVNMKSYKILGYKKPSAKMNSPEIGKSQIDRMDIRSDTIIEDYNTRLDYYLENYPHIYLEVTVSKGFYVRSLALDLGECLETYSLMASLERCRVGHLNIESSLSLDHFNDKPDLI